MTPTYIRPWIYPREAEILVHLLRTNTYGLAESNPKVKLLRKLEKEIAEAWPEDR